MSTAAEQPAISAVFVSREGSKVVSHRTKPDRRGVKKIDAIILILKMGREMGEMGDGAEA